MADEGGKPRHPFNGRLVLDGIMFVATLAVGIVFYVLAFHPFGLVSGDSASPARAGASTDPAAGRRGAAYIVTTP